MSTDLFVLAAGLLAGALSGVIGTGASIILLPIIVVNLDSSLLIQAAGR